MVVKFTEPDLVEILVKARAEVTLEAARDNHEATMQLTQGRRFVVLVDARPARGITREAREYYADPAVLQHTIAQAILIDSGISRVVGNFFIGLNRTPFPTQLFTDREAAIAWLREQAT